MPRKETIITALDLSASRVCCLIAAPQKEDKLDVLGSGIAYHNCIKRGVAVDIKGLSETIIKAVYEAEQASSRKIQTVFFNISGNHLKGIASHGELTISDKDNEITKRDVDHVMANAKAIHMPYERDIIYITKKDFIVDGEKGISDPSGMFGIKLETDLYLITAKISIIDNLKKAVRQTGLGIEGFAISGIATSRAVIFDHEKDLGVVLVDVGKDITEVLIFLSGKLLHLAVLALGGDDITRAVSEKLRIPKDAAEEIKIENATLEANSNDKKITLKTENRTKIISSVELNKIVLDEYTAIFNAVKKELTDSGYGQDASSGVVICGGPLMMEGSLELAEPILNLPVRIGHIIGLGSSPKPLPSHIYATCFGLAKYANKVKQSKRSIFTMGPKNLVSAITERARTLYRDYF